MTISIRRTIADFSNVTRAPEVGAVDTMIQPFGCMIVTDAKAQTIEYASENVAASFGVTAKEMIGAPAGDHLDATLLHNIRNIAGRPTSSKQPEFAGRQVYADQKADVFTHTRSGAIVIELLLVAEDAAANGDIAEKVQWVARDVAAAANAGAAIDNACALLLRIFDASRVAILKLTEPDGAYVDVEARKTRLSALSGAQFPRKWLTQSISQSEPSRRIRSFLFPREAAVRLLGDVSAPSPDIGISLLQSNRDQPSDLFGALSAKTLILCPLIVDGAPWGEVAITDVAEGALNGAAFDSLDLLARTLSLRLELERKTALLKVSQLALKAAMTMAAQPDEGRRLWREALSDLGEHVACDAVAFIDEHEVCVSGDAPIPLACREIAHRQAGDLSDIRIAEDISTRAAGVSALVAAISASPRRSLVFFRTEQRARRMRVAAPASAHGADIGFETDFAWWSRDDVALATRIQSALVEAARKAPAPR